MFHYSNLIFKMDVDNETPEQLENTLRRGTKIHFFTYDPIDSISENTFLKKAIKEQMLFLYEVKFNDSLNQDFIYYDGTIPETELTLLSENAVYFNKDQFIIEHAPLQENISVSAGAGTGKTTVMINRILYLKTNIPNLSFSEIGLVTFTNKAALNMREKLINKLKVYFDFTKDLKYLNWIQELKNMTIGTIHAFAERILHLNKEMLFEYREVHISQFRYKRRKIIEEVIDDFNLNYPDLFRKFKYIEQYRIIQSVENIIDQISNFSIPVERIVQMNFGKSEDDSHILYDILVKETCMRLEDYKNDSNSMDVNDLIIALDRVMNREENYIIPFKYLFIDEFQDTDRIQTKFFAYLANRFSLYLFVVGDVKQSIYRFRGADYTAFRQLASQTVIPQEYFLQKNYRTDTKLLNNLNSIFAVWPKYVDAFRFNDTDQLLSGFDSKESDETNFISKKFQTSIGRVNFLKEIENTDTAVLLRTNKEVTDFSIFCEENNIFHSSEQDGNFYRSVPVREFYQLLRRFTRPNNWKNRYTLHLSSYGDRVLEIEKLLADFSTEKTSHNLLMELDTKFSNFEERFNRMSPFKVFQEIIENVDPATVYAQRFSVNKSEKNQYTDKQVKLLRLEYQMNLNQLLYQLKKELKDNIPSLFKIEKLLSIKMQTDKTMSTIHEVDPDINRLSIMTVHKAKGLEFDQVYLPETKKLFISSIQTDVIVNQDSIGYKAYINKGKTYTNDIYKKLNKEERLENIGEETRLLYVALTRAKKAIFAEAPIETNSHTVKNWSDLIAKGFSETSSYETLFSD
ncbi:UvrD-helicase domain-containing protein [Virgibacillus indicus]|nr:UvrD-helicase domain-containing protein [Virgibacillus indicus]